MTTSYLLWGSDPGINGAQTRVFARIFPYQYCHNSNDGNNKRRRQQQRTKMEDICTTPTNDGNNDTPTSTPRTRSSRMPPPSSAARSTRSSGTSEHQSSPDSSVGASASVLGDPFEDVDPSQEDPSQWEEDSELPVYLLRAIGRLELLSLSDVEEETNEVGDGGDSDIEGDDLVEHGKAMNDALADRLATIADDDGNEIVDDGANNSILLKKGYDPGRHKHSCYSRKLGTSGAKGRQG